MKVWTLRALWITSALALGWALHSFLEPRGAGSVVWILGGVVTLFLLVEFVLRTRKRRDERASWARHERALLDPAARRRSIQELRRELARARRLGPRLIVRQTRLSVALADLQLAEGDSDGAVQTLSRLDISRLDDLQATVVRLSRARAYLHGDDLDGAAATLSPITEEVISDPVLRASLTLARGQLALEEQRPDDACAAAQQIAQIAEPHDELWDEAKALEACCMHAEGKAFDQPLGQIRAAGRERLAALGSARLRALLDASK